MSVTSSRDQHDDYWKLEIFHGSVKQMRAWLEGRRYHVGSIKNVGRLQEHISRAKLGIMSCLGFTNDELRDLILAKNIDASRYITKHNRGTREDLILLIDRANSHPSFHRFLRMPPELCNRVYGYYYAEFRDRIYAPSQPPLSRICVKSPLSNSLPMFYATCDFEFRLKRFSSTHKYYSPSRQPMRLSIGDRMMHFLHSTQPEYLAAIRSLRIAVEDLPLTHNGRCNIWCLYHVRISDDGRYVMRPDIPLWSVVLAGNGAGMTDAQARKMTAAVGAVVARVAARLGKDKLRKDDFFDLRAAIEAGCR
ncbi:hypothetical protein LTS10_007858 [Elasticomyces elasticus]|nr:hypothetical protein LTS10_007858 [Elasticomyces elasticus]